jgi:hypothetical protein
VPELKIAVKNHFTGLDWPKGAKILFKEKQSPLNRLQDVVHNIVLLIHVQMSEVEGRGSILINNINYKSIDPVSFLGSSRNLQGKKP